jgi:hypothetical protein
VGFSARRRSPLSAVSEFHQSVFISISPVSSDKNGSVSSVGLKVPPRRKYNFPQSYIHPTSKHSKKHSKKKNVCSSEFDGTVYGSSGGGGSTGQ